MNLSFPTSLALGSVFITAALLTGCGQKSDSSANAQAEPPSVAAPDATAPPAQAGPSASFAEFDRKAQAGGPLNVVFFGGSLTWGANSSNPQLTSYRGLMGEYLHHKYPKAGFMFYDAAIGGTGSKLGMFRLERDVLSHHPDLVFLDFTANDGLEGGDPNSRISYEGLLRDMISKGIPVMQAYFGFKYNFGPNYYPQNFHGYQDRLKLAAAYHTGVGDTYPYIQGKLTSGQADINVLWGIDHGQDGSHPDDPGYELFFEAVRDGYEQAVKDNVVCIVPDQPVFSDAWHIRTRQRLVDGPLPVGWVRDKTFRTSLWFDGLSSRWMGDVAVCDIKDKATVKPLKVDFTGTFVGLFGEADENGLSFKVRIDGKPVLFTPDPKQPGMEIWPANFKAQVKGRLFIWRQLSDSLAPGKHTLEIDPVFPKGVTVGQLRIESICFAGE